MINGTVIVTYVRPYLVRRYQGCLADSRGRLPRTATSLIPAGAFSLGFPRPSAAPRFPLHCPSPPTPLTFAGFVGMLECLPPPRPICPAFSISLLSTLSFVCRGWVHVSFWPLSTTLALLRLLPVKDGSKQASDGLC